MWFETVGFCLNFWLLAFTFWIEIIFDQSVFLYYTSHIIIIKKIIQIYELYLQSQKEKKEKNPWFFSSLTDQKGQTGAGPKARQRKEETKCIKISYKVIKFIKLIKFDDLITLQTL